MNQNVQCTIYRGAFSGERGVEIKAAGKTLYDGALPISYLRTASDGEISEMFPAKDSPEQGFVLAQLVSRAAEQILRLPDGTTLRVDPETLKAIAR